MLDFVNERHVGDRLPAQRFRFFVLIPRPVTNDSLELIAAARRGAAKACREGDAYIKAGIMLNDLLPEDERPRTLFGAGTAKRDRLMNALDQVNSRFGTCKAVTASHGFKRERKMRSDLRLHAWTTSIAEVPAVWPTDAIREDTMTTSVYLRTAASRHAG